jgi:hypothetical protein
MNIEEVIKDPDFLNLPPGEKQKVLVKIDKDFSNLPTEEQAKVVENLQTVVPGMPRQYITPADAWKFLKSAGREAVNQAPVIGATGGAMLGATTGPPSPLTVPVFAGAGGMLGEQFRQAMGPNVGIETPGPMSEEGVKSTGRQGLLAMLTEMGFPMVGKGLSPFKEGLSKEATELRASLAAKDMPMSPSTVAPNIVSKTAQMGADKLPFVNIVTNWYRGKLQDKLTDMAQTIKGKYSSEMIEKLEKDATTAYETFLDGVKAEKVDMSETISAMKDIYANSSKNAKKTMDTIFAQAGEGTELPIEVVKTLKKQLSTISKGNLDVKRSVNNALKEDLSKIEGGEAATEILGNADKSYRYAVISKKINNLVEKSMSSDGITENFKPLTYEQKYTPELRKSLQKDAPDIVPLLDDLLDIAKASKRDLQKLGPGGTEAKISLGAAGIGSFILAMTDPENISGNAMWAVPAAALAALSARSLMRPKGYMNQFLTSGIQPKPRITEPLKLGGRAAVMNYGRED